MELDEKDMAILALLKEDASLTTNKISKKLRIPITTVHNRIKRLNKTGVIRRYTIEVDSEKVGTPILAYVLVTFVQSIVSGKKTTQQQIARRINELPEVESVDITTGATDMMLIVRTSSMRTLNTLITTKLRQIPGVDKTQTMIVLEEI